jgi:hypothetical protein
MHSPMWPEVVRLPGLWIGCSMIFLVNAFLSACFGQWPLATVQLGTAVMATAAAAAARADDKASETIAAAAG